MPTPPLTLDNPNVQEALRIWDSLPEPKSFKAVSEQMELCDGAGKQRVARWIKVGLNLRKQDPAILDGMKAVGTGMVPNLAWVKTKGKDGAPGYSVMLKPDQQQKTTDDIREAFEGLTPAELVPEPEYADSDLLTIYPLADVHFGMLAWKHETGEAYDTNTAARRVKEWVARCVQSSPASETAIILGAGDLLHADDQTNQTPKSRHVLDVDTRHFRTLDVAIAALSACVECALQKHKRVIVRLIRGNHDEHSYLAVMFALFERYRNEPRVTVQKIPGEFFVFEFGDCLLAAHHGDKGKPDRIVMFLADQYNGQWGRTKHRFLWTGHAHKHASEDIGGVQWEQLRAVTARDAYAVGSAYAARAQLQGVTLHRDEGVKQRVYVGA